MRGLEGGDEWSDEEIAELFALLASEHQQISLQDFAAATVVPLQHEQMRQAVDAEQLGCLLADCLLSKEDTGFDADGKLRNATQRVSELSVHALEQKLVGATRKALPPPACFSVCFSLWPVTTACWLQIAESIFNKLQPFRTTSSKTDAAAAQGKAKFTYSFEDTGKIADAIRWCLLPPFQHGLESLLTVWSMERSQHGEGRAGRVPGPAWQGHPAGAHCRCSAAGVDVGMHQIWGSEGGRDGPREEGREERSKGECVRDGVQKRG